MRRALFAAVALVAVAALAQDMKGQGYDRETRSWRVNQVAGGSQPSQHPINVDGGYVQANQGAPGTTWPVNADGGHLTRVDTITNPVTVTDGSGALNVIVDSSATVAVTGPLTDAELRAGPVVVDLGANNDVTITTFPDNEPINVAQMNGTAVTMGNGASGTGVQRVTLADDSTGKVRMWDGTNTAYIDPCQREAKTVHVVNVATATTTEIANQVASEFFYICSINLVTAAAQTFALVEDDTDTCGSPTAGLNGGTSAATGWSFAANGGLTMGDGTSTIMKTTTANRYFCYITGQAAQISGTITYVSAP